MRVRKLVLPSFVLLGYALALLRRTPKRLEPANPAADNSPYHAIDAYIVEQMLRLKIPGLALAIVEGDQITYMRGFGRARPGGGTPSPQTPFVLGSTTKSITALAVMQLVEAGKIELDAPVQRFLPWFRVADPQASAQMTVRHLLHQTSGLPGIEGMILLADLDDRPGAAERQARNLSTLRLNRPVGAAFEYSNLNYNLLGLIIEVASGESYPDYIRRHIFAPLKMHHSYASRDEAKQYGLAVGHHYWFAHPIAIPDLPLPRGSMSSGQLISTSEDMAHYLIAHLNGGRFGDTVSGERILSSAGIQELLRGVAQQIVAGAVLDRYGMGWFDGEVSGTRLVSHGGNVPDFSSYMALLPEQKIGVVLLVNADHYGLPVVLPEVGNGVAALMVGQHPPPIRLGFIPWIMRGLLLIPVAQIAGVIATLRLLRCWRQDPPRRQSVGHQWRRQVLMPLIPNLTLASLAAYLKRRGLLPYLRLYMPDLAWVARVCGAIAGVWAVLRTGMVLRELRLVPLPHLFVGRTISGEGD